jgi:hypothetical protein
VSASASVSHLRILSQLTPFTRLPLKTPHQLQLRTHKPSRPTTSSTSLVKSHWPQEVSGLKVPSLTERNNVFRTSRAFWKKQALVSTEPSRVCNEWPRPQCGYLVNAIHQFLNRTLTNKHTVNVFLTDMNDFAEFNKVYASHFNTHKPARSCVAVKSLPLGVDVCALPYKIISEWSPSVVCSFY